MQNIRGKVAAILIVMMIVPSSVYANEYVGESVEVGTIATESNTTESNMTESNAVRTKSFVPKNVEVASLSNTQLERVIIGQENRSRVTEYYLDKYPFCCICCIQIEYTFENSRDSGYSYGTGFMAGKNSVYTNAHIFERDDYYVDSEGNLLEDVEDIEDGTLLEKAVYKGATVRMCFRFNPRYEEYDWDYYVAEIDINCIDFVNDFGYNPLLVSMPTNDEDLNLMRGFRAIDYGIINLEYAHKNKNIHEKVGYLGFSSENIGSATIAGYPVYSTKEIIDNKSMNLDLVRYLYKDTMLIPLKKILIGLTDKVEVYNISHLQVMLKAAGTLNEYIKNDNYEKQLPNYFDTTTTYYYQINTSSGQSGSPIVSVNNGKDFSNDPQEMLVNGIHSGVWNYKIRSGNSIKNIPRNQGMKITTEFINMIVEKGYAEYYEESK